MKDINYKTVVIIIVTSILIGFAYNYYSDGMSIIPEEPVYVDDSALDDGIKDSQSDDVEIKQEDTIINEEEELVKEDTEETKDTVSKEIIQEVSEPKEKENIAETKIEKKDKVETQNISEKTNDEFGIISYQQIKDRINNDNFLIIDARSAEDYEKGHIGNAVNIFPYDDEDTYFQKIYTQPRDKKILIYCTGGSCDLSHKLAKDMKTAGFENIFIYTGGWEEWEEKSK